VNRLRRFLALVREILNQPIEVQPSNWKDYALIVLAVATLAFVIWVGGTA
jgi:hypothetical protein